MDGENKWIRVSTEERESGYQCAYTVDQLLRRGGAAGAPPSVQCGTYLPAESSTPTHTAPHLPLLCPNLWEVM